MIMAKNSRPAGRCATATTALRGLVICCLALVVPTDGEDAHRLHQRVGERRLRGKPSVLEEFYFSEFLAESDEPLVLLDEGPFKLTASCRNITYSYSDWESYYSSYYSTSSAYYGSSSPGYTTGSPSSSTWTSWTHSDSTYTGSYYFDDDYWYYTGSYYFDDDYWYYGTYTESIAALELTYTADDSDYLFGSPTWVWYPHEEKVVGSYEAGETRTQIVLAGYDGGWSSECTLQSLSGAYFSTNGDNTIGFHTTNDRNHGTPEDYSYPAGVDCMMAGVISYFVPESASA